MATNKYFICSTQYGGCRAAILLFAIFHFRLSLPLFVCCYCCKTQLFMHVTSFSANQQQQQQQQHQQDEKQLE